MTRKRRIGIAGFLARAALAAAPALLCAAACNGEAPAASVQAGGITSAVCKVRTDCGYRAGVDAGPPGPIVCLLGYCGRDPPPCTTPCTGAWLGYTCVHSGVQAHCDGCSHDSACLPPPDCQTVTGHPCNSDLDGGWQWHMSCPDGMRCITEG